MPVKSKKGLGSRVKGAGKGLIVLLLVIFWSSCAICQAAPCYGTRMPGKNRIATGLQYYNIFNRYLDHSDNGKVRSQQEFLLVSYGLFDWLSLDLKGGAGSIKQHPENRDECSYSQFLAGGYGFRVRLLEREKIKAVFGFQHISVHPKQIHLSDGKHKAVLDDWQLSALVSYDLKKITPYLGARWSRCDYIHWIDGTRSREKSDLGKSYGLIFGCDVPFTKNLWLNLEGSAFDSQALAVSLNYGF
jgi:hypothetical protein